jgi:hypothetical protein
MTISEADYAQTVGETFIQVRGAGFNLSPLDLQQIGEWFEEGVPLHIPVAVLTEVSERRRQSGGERVRALTYVSEEVEARYAEWLEGRVGAR